MGGVAGRSMHLTVNQEMRVRFSLPPQEFLQEIQSSSLQYLMPSFLKVL